MRSHALFAASLGLMFSGAFAATQGTLGATSQGSFTNTFNGTVAPQVQILGLSDATVTPSIGQVQIYEGTPSGNYGVADYFCVVNTTGGAVTMSVSSDRYSAGSLAAVAAGGSELQYAMVMHVAGDVSISREFNANWTDWTMPAGTTVKSAAQCGMGNVRKAIYHVAIDGNVIAAGPLPGNGNVYVGTVTITVTPQ